MSEQEIKPEPMNVIFARTMEILTLGALLLMAIPGMAYVFGTKGFVGVASAYHNWSQPLSQFWEATKGINISGYGWFLKDFRDLDCLSLDGILVLALIPLVCVIVSILKTDIKYRFIFGIISIEFVFAIIRPLLGAVGH